MSRYIKSVLGILANADSLIAPSSVINKWNEEINKELDLNFCKIILSIVL
jgi:hypothetical protein